jgi:hypothetical protein
VDSSSLASSTVVVEFAKLSVAMVAMCMVHLSNFCCMALYGKQS